MGQREFQRLVQVAKYGFNSFSFCPVPLGLDLARVRGPFQEGYGSAEPFQTKLFSALNLSLGHPVEERWAIIGPAGAGKTTLLQILQGRYVSLDKDARTYPALEALADIKKEAGHPGHLISYIGPPRRDGYLAGASGQGTHLSARYESNQEDSDLTLGDYLTGDVHLNPEEGELESIEKFSRSRFFRMLVTKFKLKNLVHQPLSSLSNGQTRRARIARALTHRPGLLLLDEPFTGLDPLMRLEFSKLLSYLSKSACLGVVCAFEDTEELPSFVTHIAYINEQHELVAAGPRVPTGRLLRKQGYAVNTRTRNRAGHFLESRTVSAVDRSPRIPDHSWYMQGDAAVYKAETNEQTPVIEMEGVQVHYATKKGTRTVLGGGKQLQDGTRQRGLWWTVHQGERWGIFGANGAGKTTLLSLITSDHPQAYSQPLKVFGHSRLPSAGKPGLSVFDLQARIGQASPEIHNFFPRDLSVRQTLESAWAETFRSTPQMGFEDDEVVDATLRWFHRFLNPAPTTTGDHRSAPKHSRFASQWMDEYEAIDTDWADDVRFSDLDFSAQRTALFLRAIIRRPDLVILDEAFGGMPAMVRMTCMTWLAFGQRTVIESGQRGIKMRQSKHERHDTNSYFDHRPRAVKFAGLEPRQTLLCVAHRKEDVPPIINRWILLPPEGGVAGRARSKLGIAPRFGELDFRITKWRAESWWDDVWTDGPKKTSGGRK